MIFKLKAYLIGFLLSLLPNKIFLRIVEGTNPKIGLDVVNSDLETISKFKPKIIRINQPDLNFHLVQYLEKNNIEYYIQTGRPEDTNYKIAQEIIETDIRLSGLKKPLFYSIVNENNEFTWKRLKDIESLIHEKIHN